VRLLVVGASSGIGRAVALGAAHDGDDVVAAARRIGLLRELPVDVRACDVRRPEDCAAVVAHAARQLGGLDAVVYAAGVSPLVPVADAGAEVWREVMETNVVGAALVVRAALPALSAVSGRALFVSSDSVPRPYPGLVAYAASKAALNTLVEGWRIECPNVGFTRFSVGPTVTGFADGWDPARTAEFFARWEAEAYLRPGQPVMAPEQVATEVLRILRSPVRLDDVVLRAGG
jgi:NAD(P)-dependent dehydrogenase (short-subunit alcohol dehydrogenase family)